MEQLKIVVEHIFNNWSALQLAVEHGMGGSTSKEIAIQSVDYVTNYCINEIQSIEAEDIQDILEDIMDEEFQTICEDNSPKEIAIVIFRFLQLIKAGDTNQFQIEYNNLPKSNKDWLSKPSVNVPSNSVPVSNAASESVEPSTSNTPMDEDPEWTQVRTRRRK